MSDAILVTKPTAPEWWLKQHAKNPERAGPAQPTAQVEAVAEAAPPVVRKHNERNHVRAAEWVRLHCVELLTLTDIALRYGVTRERVRQVLRREGVPLESTAAALAAKSLRESKKHCEACGVKMRPARVRVCSDTCKETLRNRRIEARKAELLRHLRTMAARLGHTPKQIDLVGTNSHMQYHKYFGSLRTAQELAGLTPNRRGYYR